MIPNRVNSQVLKEPFENFKRDLYNRNEGRNIRYKLFNKTKGILFELAKSPIVFIDKYLLSIITMVHQYKIYKLE